MASLYTDGFDQYGPPVGQPSALNAETYMNAEGWNFSLFTSPIIVASLNGLSGYALQLQAESDQNGSVMNRTLATTYSRLIGGARLASDLFDDCGFLLLYGSTYQCSVVISKTSGQIAVKEGKNGVTIALANQSISANVAHYLEWDITFAGGTSGNVAVWLDGVQILNVNGNTAPTGNNVANGVGFFAGFGALSIDDFYVFDTTTAYNAAALLSNPMVVTQQPISDYSVSFSNLGNVIGNTISLLNDVVPANALDIPANTLYLMQVTPNVTCLANSIYVYAAGTDVWSGSYTAKLKASLYADSSGVPGALISAGTVITGIPPGAFLPLPLTTPSTLSVGVPYWIGLQNDTAIYAQKYATNAILGAEASYTFTNGTPSTAPTMTPDISSLQMFVSCTNGATNWQSEALNPPLGDLSVVSSSTVGITDLYVFPVLPQLVESVYCVTVGGNARVTFAGFRTMDLLASSSGTVGSGNNSNIVLTTAYLTYSTNFDTDPHTSAAWSVTAVNNSYAGMSVAS